MHISREVCMYDIYMYAFPFDTPTQQDTSTCTYTVLHTIYTSIDTYMHMYTHAEVQMHMWTHTHMYAYKPTIQHTYNHTHKCTNGVNNICTLIILLSDTQQTSIHVKVQVHTRPYEHNLQQECTLTMSNSKLSSCSRSA